MTESLDSLKAKLAFTEIQRDTFAQSWPAHKTTNVVQRLRALDARIADLKRQIKECSS